MSTKDDTPSVRFPAAEEVTMSLGDALALGLRLHQSSRLMEAEALYRQILAAHPEQPDALHFLGLIHHQLGDDHQAVDLISRAIGANPDYADAYNNLGNILREHRQFDEAAALYGRALALRPEHADAHNNLGTVLSALGRLDEAVDAYQRALAIQPDHASAQHNLRTAMATQKREAVAVAADGQGVATFDADAFRNLGNSLYLAGRLEDAADVYRQWLRHEPGHPVAAHLLAACSGRDAPARASDTYVQNLYDTLAHSFDERLAFLGYRAPQLVVAAVAQALGAAGPCDILDAGCGTGLCGPLLRPYARRLVGVDLSPAMLERARERGAYDELVRGELTEYLGECPKWYDVIVSVDTLVYFGTLEPPFAAAARALHPGGYLVFSVERSADAEAPQGFRLNPHGRYSHTEAYLQQMLETCRFEMPSITAAPLRRERGKVVEGLIVVAKKGGMDHDPRG